MAVNGSGSRLSRLGSTAALLAVGAAGAHLFGDSAHASVQQSGEGSGGVAGVSPTPSRRPDLSPYREAFRGYVGVQSALFQMVRGADCRPSSIVTMLPHGFVGPYHYGTLFKVNSGNSYIDESRVDREWKVILRDGPTLAQSFWSLAKTIKAMDANNDGDVDESEFEQFSQKLLALKRTEDASRALDAAAEDLYLLDILNRFLAGELGPDLCAQAVATVPVYASSHVPVATSPTSPAWARPPKKDSETPWGNITLLLSIIGAVGAVVGSAVGLSRMSSHKLQALTQGRKLTSGILEVIVQRERNPIFRYLFKNLLSQVRAIEDSEKGEVHVAHARS